MMTTKIRRIELMDLSDPKQAEFAIKMVGMCLKQAGPKAPIKIVKINSDTLEGRMAIQEYLKKGFRVVSRKEGG